MWTTDSDVGSLNEMSRDRNRLCIEDPFETSYVRLPFLFLFEIGCRVDRKQTE